LSDFVKVNLAFMYALNSCTFSILACSLASTAVWAALRSGEVSVAVLVAPAANRAASPFFSATAFLLKNASSILDTSTPSRDTLVEVATTYFWFTLRRGTPFTE
jgi:hypothetical protein